MIDYARRQAQLMTSLDVDAFLVVHLEATDPDRASMFYLTGYPGFGVLMVTPETIHAYASRTNIGMAAAAAPHLDWQILDWEYQKVIVSLLNQHGFRRVGLASRRIGLLTGRALEAGSTCELVVDEDPVGRVRCIKDADEIQRILRATEITEAALEETLAIVRPGMTEAQIAWHLECDMRERGAEAVGFELIVSAGAHSALPHHVPADQPIRPGDVLLFDIGARYQGYCSDITRVVSIGRPPDRLRRLYDIVLDANRAGIEAFAPGVSGPTVDKAARDVIERAGYGEQYTHGLSHGVGIEIHEMPVSEGSRAVPAYEPGMVCTAEPGIYLPGVGGIRIEDLLVITNEGCRVLSRFPKDRLIEIG
jgi:Xaa-Pro aminopeptidase